MVTSVDVTGMLIRPVDVLIAPMDCACTGDGVAESTASQVAQAPPIKLRGLHRCIGNPTLLKHCFAKIFPAVNFQILTPYPAAVSVLQLFRNVWLAQRCSPL
jgi:hypothetical protein